MGIWLHDPRELRAGDVFAEGGPGSPAFIKWVVRNVTTGPLVEHEFLGREHTSRTVTVEYSSAERPNLLGAASYIIYPFNASSFCLSHLFLIHRPTTDEDIERLEHELAAARARKANEEKQVRAERIRKAACALSNWDEATDVVYSWARAAAERLEERGLLAK